MRVPNFVLDFAKRKLMPLSAEIPDEIIGPGYRWRKTSGLPPTGLRKPFLIRWFVIPKNKWCNIYLHKFMRDDEDRALHDHPWLNVSLLLINRYIEVTRGEVRKMYQAGDLKFRFASTPHRIELVRTRKTGHKRTKAHRERGQPSWSLFITGPVTRGWGFHCPRGWREQKEFHERGGCE
jgi:hypothetical protein